MTHCLINGQRGYNRVVFSFFKNDVTKSIKIDIIVERGKTDKKVKKERKKNKMNSKIKKITALLLLLIISMTIFILPTNADEPTRSKYYSNVTTTAGIVSGVLNIHNLYIVSPSTGFTSAEIHTYVERKTLGIFWVKVDNGQPNKTWVDTSTSKNYSKSYSLTLTQTGTYRVTADYTFYGSSGSESITMQKTVTY